MNIRRKRDRSSGQNNRQRKGSQRKGTGKGTGKDTAIGMQPLDRAASMMIVLMSVVIAAMLVLGSQALPSVRTFSWQDKAVSAEDVAFMFTFTQPVEQKSVEQNLTIEPELDGKFSWAGRRMAYTLNASVPYGETYKIELPTAQALSGQDGFEPFESSFKTRDRVFAYIGAEGEEKGRLVLFNLTRKERQLLTPERQEVMDFKVYPQRDRILYSAVGDDDIVDGATLPQLYTVSTGLSDGTPSPPRWKFWSKDQRSETAESGIVQPVLDNQDFQNLKFDLAPNGEVIVVQRVNREKPSDYGPWVIMAGEQPRRLETDPGGDFTIAPDSASLLLQQGQGTAVINLTPDTDADEPEALLDFLPDYGLTLDIASDGSAAALVNFNEDDPEKRFTQSLFWVSNKGDEKQLLQTEGAILSAQFNENNEILYCLVNKLLPGEGYQVIPYLTAVNVVTGEEQKLLEMPPQPEITVSLSPDGLAILFDEALTSDPKAAALDENFVGATHRLWLLPLFSTLDERVNNEPVALPPTELEISGRHPSWLP